MLDLKLEEMESMAQRWPPQNLTMLLKKNDQRFRSGIRS